MQMKSLHPDHKKALRGLFESTYPPEIYPKVKGYPAEAHSVLFKKLNEYCMTHQIHMRLSDYIREKTSNQSKHDLFCFR